MSIGPTLNPRADLGRRLAMLGSVAAIGAALIAATATTRSTVAATPAASAELAVVELFTSQGCSSCPPANANLVALSRRPDVLALSFSVTYWDQLGWRDTFSQDVFTRRQRDYQRGLGNPNVWTPQVIVDGRADVVGGRRSEIERLIDSHRRFTGPTIIFRNGSVGLAGGAVPATPADIWLVRFEPRPIAVPVETGENSGRTLPHAAVVRELVRLGTWNGQTTGLHLPLPSRSGLAAAVIVQAPNGGPILAAARS